MRGRCVGGAWEVRGRCVGDCWHGYLELDLPEGERRGAEDRVRRAGDVRDVHPRVAAFGRGLPTAGTGFAEHVAGHKCVGGDALGLRLEVPEPLARLGELRALPEALGLRRRV